MFLADDASEGWVVERWEIEKDMTSPSHTELGDFGDPGEHTNACTAVALCPDSVRWDRSTCVVEQNWRERMGVAQGEDAQIEVLDTHYTVR